MLMVSPQVSLPTSLRVITLTLPEPAAALVRQAALPLAEVAGARQRDGRRFCADKPVGQGSENRQDRG